ncbi:MAG: hypothetical protein IK062_03035 [Selenomonadaceae bacterium]|nr:hypothetical protein [Selenomonadaceae bacterium]
MTKILTKLPVTVESIKDFRENALKKMISKASSKLEENFSVLCEEFDQRFKNNEWIKMQNKNVYYNNDIFGLIPNLNVRNCNYQYGNLAYNTNNLKNLEFEGFAGDLPTYHEAVVLFVNKTNYFCNGNYIRVCGLDYLGLTYKGKDSSYFYYDTYRNWSGRHGNGYADNIWTIPIFRFGAEDYSSATSGEAILTWLMYDLYPSSFKTEKTKKIFDDLKNFYAKYEDYFFCDEDSIFLDDDEIFSAILAGSEFDFLPNAKNLLTATEVKASEDFLNDLKDELLNGDKIRAELDPYDENILLDPNRGHWDLWDYGEGEEKAGEITLSEGMTARNPADDINHGIVAIDFGTKSTVVVYENDNMQILPLQVGSGDYGKGVKAENYENPTVIQFLNIENFVEAYNSRAGRPKTKWNDVTVSHTAFDNMTNSDSKHFCSFLKDLKRWCGSDERIKIKDRNEVTKDLPPFLELMEGDINPLEYYAYYLGLYINNMLQEKRIFLKYIMSFPVTYDKAIRERMRRAFDRGIKKSLPTALLSNEEAMKNFIVQDGTSEPAAYAITALQEYNFDPEGNEENYYAVFDFGGGTTDFDFGVFRESKLDRYDYSLIHFGENGDKTLGGENLLELLAFEVFKANQETLLNPGDKNVGKIPFTFAADKKDFVGSAALIKDSQEAHLNMHNLAEKLRPVWEEPDSDKSKKILSGNEGIDVDLTTDKSQTLSQRKLHIAFKDSGTLDLQKILRDRIEQGVKNFFVAMKEAFIEGGRAKELNIKSLGEIDEISIFLAGNSSKSKIVQEIFNEYLGLTSEKISDEEFPFNEDGILKVGYSLKDGYIIEKGVILKNETLFAVIDDPEDREKILQAVQKWQEVGNSSNTIAQKILGLEQNKMPKFKIYPALGTSAAHEIQKSRGVEVDINDIAAPTGKTGVAFGLLKCRDSGNVQITHLTPDKNRTPFQFYIGRNKKRKFKTIIDKNTKLDVWYAFIDAGNSFDILYSDLPEAVDDEMPVTKAKRINVVLEKCDPKLTVFIRAVKSNVIEYQVAADIEDLDDAEKMKGVEPVPITLT